MSAAVPQSTSCMDEPYLSLRGITKTFGSFVALADISLDVKQGEFICFLGPSGCGKTTLLRIIAGLEEQNVGQVIQNGIDISQLPPGQRDFGIVFQSYALLPNLSAFKNVAYGLENKRMPRKEIKQRVDELLEMVGLTGFGRQYPAQLSGGQQQRVALARALALSPGLLLLDEPLSALDARVRATLRGEIARLQRRLGVTTIMVTHDQEEALTMADRIVVMDQGRLVQMGTPLDIYHRPSTLFVANFVGITNFVSGVAQEGAVRVGDLLIKTPATNGHIRPGDAVQLAIRPEDLRLVRQGEGAASSDNVFAMRMLNAEFLGAFYRLTMSFAQEPDQVVRADLMTNGAQDLGIDQDSELYIRMHPNAIRVFAAS